jgi:peptidoglycan hydrolase CwlO-like protein
MTAAHAQLQEQLESKSADLKGLEQKIQEVTLEAHTHQEKLEQLRHSLDQRQQELDVSFLYNDFELQLTFRRPKLLCNQPRKAPSPPTIGSPN